MDKILVPRTRLRLLLGCLLSRRMFLDTFGTHVVAGNIYIRLMWLSTLNIQGSGVQFNTLKNVTKIVTKIIPKVQFEKEICINY